MFIGIGTAQLSSVKGPSFSISDLFANGERGVWYEMKPENLYQDEAGTVPVAAAGDPVFRGNDLSPNAIPFYAPTSAARPLWQASEDLLFDLVDDKITVDFGATTFAGTVWVKTPNGILKYEVSTTGIWEIPTTTSKLHDNNLGPILAVEGFVTEPRVIDYMGVDNKFASVTALTGWFMNRRDITKLFSTDWNTASVTNLAQFTYSCQNLIDFDVSKWDTSNVTNVYGFLYDCRTITTLDVSNWYTGNITSFQSFAHGCRDLTTLNVSNWNTGSAVSFVRFANNCTSLTTIDVSTWDVSNVSDFNNFANGCSVLDTLDVSSWNTSSVTNFNVFTAYCVFTILDVSNWNTINVTDFSLFVYKCPSLTSLDLSSWTTANVTKFNNFAYECISLTEVIVNGGTGNPFADSPCTNYTDAFTGTNLTQQSIDDILVAIEAAGTSNGTFDQSGGFAPSVTGQAAIDALRARGWAITVTGAY